MSEQEATKGEWAVAVREAESGKGFFVHQAEHVDERAARKAFGLAIRAGEVGLPVAVDEGDTVKITVVRLVRWEDGPAALLSSSAGNSVLNEIGGWKVTQEHQCGVIERWKAMSVVVESSTLGGAPYREDAFHPGVPCHLGAWGSSERCAMHWGLPLDEEHGMCAEGIRGANYLGLVLIPKRLQEKFGLHQTMTREELDIYQAGAVAELVMRGKDDKVSDEQLTRACATLEVVVGRLNNAHERRGYSFSCTYETPPLVPEDS